MPVAANRSGLKKMNASNRQKKFLRFFDVLYSPDISAGAAGWEIGNILFDENNRIRWWKYLYLTKDFGSDSSALQPFNEDELESLELPDGWSAEEAIQKIKDEIVEAEISDGTPFDNPAPVVSFADCSFIFTGKFGYGSRKECQSAVTERGGSAPSRKSVSREIDYLVIGTGGSKSWKRGSYGNKIEAAIISRREHGAPAIISEDHWRTSLTKV